MSLMGCDTCDYYGSDWEARCSTCLSALRVAGPDDAIVPLDALRVAVKHAHDVSTCAMFKEPWLGVVVPGSPACDCRCAPLTAAIAAATPPEQHHA